MYKYCNYIIVTVSVFMFAASAHSQVVSAATELPTRGLLELKEAGDMSAVAALQGFLLVGVDEVVKDKDDKEKKRNIIQLLKPSDGGYEVTSEIKLCHVDGDDNCIKGQRKEMDIEAIAVDGDIVYVAGSHAVARRKVDPDKHNYRKNRARLSANNTDEVGGIKKTGWKDASPRARLVRFRLHGDGTTSDMQEVSLSSLLDGIAPLTPFRHLPSKENGVDIEGLAVKDDKLIVGFRAPVFNGKFAIVIRFDFDEVAGRTDTIDEGDVRYVLLDGLGIRSLASVSDGFLILAGPPGQAPGPYRLYHWDGLDMVPGEGSPGGQARLISELRTSDGAKPEGLIIFDEATERYEIGIVEDSAKSPVLRRFHIDR